jgi:integrase
MAATGIRQRHGNGCNRPKSGCKCPWQAEVYSPRDGKKIRKLFPGKSEAQTWRDDWKGRVKRKEVRAPTPQTVREAADAWLEGARAGTIRTSKGLAYKPATMRRFEQALRLRVIPEFGRCKLAELTISDLQDFVDQLQAEGLTASSVGVTISTLRAIYGRAVLRADSGITVNPTKGLKMPAVESGRERIATAQEAADLLAALPESERPIWATMFYGGLRNGEVQALRVEDIDLGANVLHVRRGWDWQEGEQTTKSGRARKVPIAKVLRDYLDWHLLTLPWRDRPDALVFGVEERTPFSPSTLAERARRAWGWKKHRGKGEEWFEDPERKTLDPICPHECRHTAASLWIAAGMNAKTVSEYMGHSSISITMDLYGHLMPGNESESAGLLDAYLEEQAGGAE